METSRTISLGDAAKILGTTTRGVLDLIDEGALGFRRETQTIAGRSADRICVPREDVDRLLDREV